MSVRPVSEKFPGTSPTHCSSAPLVSPKVSVPQAPETKTLPARWPSSPPWPARRVVGADGGAEGDAAVGRAGHDHAEAHPRHGAEVVGEVAVRVGRPHRAVVVDVVAEAEPGVAEERYPLRRSRASGQADEGRRRGHERASHRSLHAFLFRPCCHAPRPAASVRLPGLRDRLLRCNIGGWHRGSASPSSRRIMTGRS